MKSNQIFDHSKERHSLLQFWGVFFVGFFFFLSLWMFPKHCITLNLQSNIFAYLENSVHFVTSANKRWSALQFHVCLCFFFFPELHMIQATESLIICQWVLSVTLECHKGLWVYAWTYQTEQVSCTGALHFFTQLLLCCLLFGTRDFSRTIVQLWMRLIPVFPVW